MVLEAFEDLQCHGPEDCKLLQVANLTMQDPVIKDGRIPYYITLPATIQDGKYGISATLNTGWCQNEHSKKWVKYGDYHNTIAATVFIFDKKKSYKKDIYVDLYKEPTKGQGKSITF